MKTVLHIGKFQRATTQQRKKTCLPPFLLPSLSISFFLSSNRYFSISYTAGPLPSTGKCHGKIQIISLLQGNLHS